MSNTSTLEHEYVQQREFDIYIQNIKERADIDRELTVARFDKFEAVMVYGLRNFIHGGGNNCACSSGTYSKVREIRTEREKMKQHKRA